MLGWQENSVAANLLMAIFLVGGFIISTQVKQEVFPEFTTDIVNVIVPYPGASPSEVEQGLILSIEDAVRGLEGVKRVTSQASEGNGSVIIELLNSADPSKLVQDVKNAVDRITSFPEDAERPIVNLVEARRRVVSLLVYGKQDPRNLRGLAERIRDDLVQRPGVTFVELGQAPPLEISIEISQENLRAYNLSLEEVANLVKRTALELPGGEVRTDAGRILLRTQERRDYGKEFLDIPITSTKDGTFVTLKDIASIKDGFEEIDQEAKFADNPAVFVNVFRVGDETPQEVSKAVNNYIDEIKSELPNDIGLKIWDDTSLIYKDRMNLLLKNAVLGLILVLILLGLFLEARLAFWVTLGIPISIMGCFLFMPISGASINMISLFAFIVTLGIIVDDAVVTGENIYEMRQQGLSTLDAAVKGARQIAMPVVFAVLTNIVAFLPLFFVPGVSGKFFMQIPAVVVGVFIISLIESLFILPSHLAHPLKERKIWHILDKPRQYFSRHLRNIIENYYTPAINKIIKARYLTLAIAISTLIIAIGSIKGGYIRFSFLPRIDADIITAQATLTFGTPIEESRRVQKLLIDAANKTIKDNGGDGITKGVYSQIGSQLLAFGPGPGAQLSTGGHLVATQVSLVSSEKRSISGSEFSRQWRKNVGQIVGLESIIFKAETGASEGAAIEFNLNHRDTELLEEAAKELKLIIEEYAGVTDADDGVTKGKRQLSFKVSPEARSLGITASELGRQVRAAFFGAEALRQQRGRNEVKIRVRLPENERETLKTLDRLIIKSPAGAEIPLKNAAEIIEGTSYTEINRRNGRRVITVSAEVDSLVSNSNQIIDDLVNNAIPKLQEKYPGLNYSFGGEKEAQKESMASLGIRFFNCNACCLCHACCAI